MSNELKAAAYTALWTFLGTALTALTGFLAAVEGFINGNDPTLQDDLSNLTRIVLSALVAAVSGFVGFVVRKVTKLQAPDYSSDEG